MIPDNEIQIDFVRASGPGGQNVNKVSTKAQLRWGVGNSTVFSDEEKMRIRAFAGNKLNASDEIVIASSSQRSQLQNKEAAIQRLEHLVEVALTPIEERKPTRPTRASKKRRITSKKHRGAQKKLRGYVEMDE